MSVSLMQKLVRTAGAIAVAALATGGTSGAPTPMVELPKQAVIAAGDIALCVTIYTIWFEVRISSDDMRELLVDGGFAAVSGGVLVYTGVKATEGALGEALNLLGPLGWGLKATITGTVTSIVGALFWMLCETPPAWLKPKAA